MTDSIPPNLKHAQLRAPNTKINIEEIVNFANNTPGLDPSKKAIDKLTLLFLGRPIHIKPQDAIPLDVLERANSTQEVVDFQHFCRQTKKYCDLFPLECDDKTPKFTLQLDSYTAWDAVHEWWTGRMDAIQNISKLDNGWYPHAIKLFSRYQTFALLGEQNWWRDGLGVRKYVPVVDAEAKSTKVAPREIKRVKDGISSPPKKRRICANRVDKSPIEPEKQYETDPSRTELLQQLKTARDTIAALELNASVLVQQLTIEQRENVTLRRECVDLKNVLADNEIQRGQLETYLMAERQSKISEMGVSNTCEENLIAENAKLRRKLHTLSIPEEGNLADADLERLTKRRHLTLPDAKHRIDVRGFFQYHEVLERWGGEDPKNHNELVLWFRGLNDRGTAPRGAQFWLDAMKSFGYDPKPYDDINKGHPLKLEVEHMLCQNMCGEQSSLLRGIMNLYALEGGFNRTVDFTQTNTRAKQAFFGKRTVTNHRGYVRWRDTGNNRYLPSLYFLRSVQCTDMELCTPRYMSSGLRSSGMTRQLRIVVGRENEEDCQEVPILLLK